jgi:hypothetical protein
MEATMSLLTAANDEAVRLIRESTLGSSELVDRLLRNDEILIPAKVMEACRRAQAELLIAAVDQERPQRPSKQPPRSPFRRRG